MPTIYDYPQYYDLLFGWDRSAEAQFYHRIFERAGIESGEPLLEVACGTGRIAIELARQGHNVTGMDIRADMLTFLEARAAAAGTSVRTVRADMTTFADSVTYAGAYNPMSSLRILQTDTELDAHLAAMATALGVGGLYVLDMDFADRMDAPPITTEEAWEMTGAGITVRATDELIYVNDNGVALSLEWGSDNHLRNYTCATFTDRLNACRSFVVQSWHPESGRAGTEGISVFDAEQPVPVCTSGRTMVVLRRV